MSTGAEAANLVGDAAKKYDGTDEKKGSKESQMSPKAADSGVAAGDGAKEQSADREEKEDFAPALVLSCLVFWLCGFLFGLAAFVFALLGKGQSDKGKSAKGWKVISYVISVIGILVGLSIVVVVLYLHKAELRSTPSVD